MQQIIIAGGKMSLCPKSADSPTVVECGRGEGEARHARMAAAATGALVPLRH